MRGRRSAWSDEAVQELARRFVPAADEVHYLHHGKASECDFFRGFCEEGHYGGRTQPTDTRQGIYCVAPSGAFLASVNTTHPRHMEKMLKDALAAWEKLPKEKRFLVSPPQPSEARGRAFPEGGLALRAYVRDLPRKDPPKDWRGSAWNTDTTWFSKEEAHAFLPEKLAVGEKKDASADRLARFALLDSVRGQTAPYRPGEVKDAVLSSAVTKVDGDRVTLRLTGRTHAESGERGLRVNLDGHAVYDKANERFVEFEFTASGERWGATRYNAREDDLEPSPIGFVFRLAADDDRVAPAYWYAYGR